MNKREAKSRDVYGERGNGEKRGGRGKHERGSGTEPVTPNQVEPSETRDFRPRSIRDDLHFRLSVLREVLVHLHEAVVG